MLRIASVDVKQGEVYDHTHGPWKTLTVVYGDHAPLLARVNAHLTNALKYAANQNQAEMIQAYISRYENECRPIKSRHFLNATRLLLSIDVRLKV